MTYTPFDAQIDQFFNDALRTVSSGSRTWKPATNVYEDEHGFHVEVALPGLDSKSIEIVAEDGVLTLKGERKNGAEGQDRTWLLREMGWGSFSRSFSLPTYVEQSQAKAAYKDGILSVTLPKREEAKPRRIDVAVQ
jgi:HSP20 family protein